VTGEKQKLGTTGGVKKVKQPAVGKVVIKGKGK